MKKILLLCLLLPCSLFSQNERYSDSLRSLLKIRPDTARARILLLLSNPGLSSEWKVYSAEMKKVSLSLLKSANPEDRMIGNKYLGYSLINEGKLVAANEKFDEAIALYTKSIAQFNANNLQLDAAHAYQEMSITYTSIGELQKALNCQFTLLKIGTRLKHKTLIAYSFNDIGNLYKRMGSMDSSLYYTVKAVSALKETKDMKGLAAAYGNIAQLFKLEGNSDSALFYSVKSLDCAKELNDKTIIARSQNNLALVYKSRATLTCTGADDAKPEAS
jgi:tetratricopeptide (TPR) repeat protein